MANSITMFRLAAPVQTAVTPVVGGTLVAGTTYYYKIVPWRAYSTTYGAGTNSSYHHINGPASNEISFLATAVNKSCTLNWNIPDGLATFWMIFRSTTSGSFPRSSLLGIKTATVGYTDTGIATSNWPLQLACDIDVDMPAINVLGYWREENIPTSGTQLGWNYIYNYTGLTVDAYKDRIIYFTGLGRFTDPYNGLQRRYARVLYNTATTIYLDSNVAVVPGTSEAYKVAWKPQDIYDASVIGAWGNINALSHCNTGLPIVQKLGDNSYRINASFYNNYFDDAANWSMFGMSNQTIEMGEGNRFYSWYNASIYGRDTNFTMNGTNLGETMQSGFAPYGPQDFVGFNFKVRTNSAGISSLYGNESVQPSMGYETLPKYGANRWSNSTFQGIRAISPYLGTDFLNNSFIDNGQAAENAQNSYNYVKSITRLPLASHFRLASALEYNMYNNDIVGGTYGISAYALDSDDNRIVNPSKAFSDNIKVATTWTSSPIAGRIKVQYQIGMNVKNSITGLPIEDAILEVFDKDGQPIYADICGDAPADRPFYTRNVWSTTATNRQVRGAIYPKVKTTEFKVAGYNQGRYSGIAQEGLAVSVGYKKELQQSDIARSGKAIKIDTISSSRLITYPYGADQTALVDVTFYYRPEKLPTVNSAVVARMINTGGTMVLDMYYDTAGALYIAKANGAAISPSTTPTRGVFHKIRITYLQTTGAINFYVDDVLISTGTNSSLLGFAKLQFGHINTTTMTSYYDDLSVSVNSVVMYTENFDGPLYLWTNVGGEYGEYVSPTIQLPASLISGYVYQDGETVHSIDPTRVYLTHSYGNYRYWQVMMQTYGNVDGIGAKTNSVDETQTILPGGYGSPEYTPNIRLFARRFYTNPLGRIPLIDFDAFSVRHTVGGASTANDITYRTPWTVKISKVGYKTQQFKFSPEGLYEKEFNINLEPLNYKSLKLINVRRGVSIAK